MQLELLWTQRLAHIADITEWGKESLSPDVFCFCVSGLYGKHLPTSGGGFFLRFAALRVPGCHQ